MRKTISPALIILVLIISATQPRISQAQPDPFSYKWTRVGEKFDSPLYLTHAGDGSGRLFVVEQAGKIWVMVGEKTLTEPFLDISDTANEDAQRGGYSERGLLGMAFHPDYKNNGLFFIDYVDNNNNTTLSRFKVMANNPNKADPTSEVKLLSFNAKNLDHKGGMIAFGPDGYLYMSIGDGGGQQGDLEGYAQNTNVLLGKIIRIDVNADTYKVPATNPFVGKAGYAPEIWAIGLRNPWRFSFDRETGDMYIGDVGVANWEEIDFQPADSKGGENYGWNFYEGKTRFRDATAPANIIMPIFDYPHQTGCASVTGGYVYRGGRIPALRGIYFFGDYCDGRVWITTGAATRQWQTTLFKGTGKTISSFGEDERGDLYLVDYKGGIYRLDPS